MLYNRICGISTLKLFFNGKFNLATNQGPFFAILKLRINKYFYPHFYETHKLNTSHLLQIQSLSATKIETQFMLLNNFSGINHHNKAKNGDCRKFAPRFHCWNKIISTTSLPKRNQTDAVTLVFLLSERRAGNESPLTIVAYTRVLFSCDEKSKLKKCQSNNQNLF